MGLKYDATCGQIGLDVITLGESREELEHVSNHIVEIHNMNVKKIYWNRTRIRPNDFVHGIQDYTYNT